MNAMSPLAAERFGHELWRAGFRPLPDVDDKGTLVGVLFWRVRAGRIHILASRPHGVAYAFQVVAEFNFRQPFHHGPIVDGRFGHAVDALHWLLTTATPPQQNQE